MKSNKKSGARQLQLRINKVFTALVIWFDPNRRDEYQTAQQALDDHYNAKIFGTELWHPDYALVHYNYGTVWLSHHQYAEFAKLTGSDAYDYLVAAQTDMPENSTPAIA